MTKSSVLYIESRHSGFSSIDDAFAGFSLPYKALVVMAKCAPYATSVIELDQRLDHLSQLHPHLCYLASDEAGKGSFGTGFGNL